MFDGFIKGFRRSFPSFPATKAQFYLRLTMSGYLFLLMLLMFFVHPIKKSVNVSSLILQFGSAAVLWWESITKPENIDLIGTELQNFDVKRPLSTKLERITLKISNMVSHIIYFSAVFLISIQVLFLSVSDSTQDRLKLQLLVWSSGIALLFFIRFVGKSADRYISMVSSKIESSRGDVEARRMHARYAVRSIAFCMFSVGTLIQIVLAWLS